MANETSDNATVDENVLIGNTHPAATNSTVTVPVCKSCLRPGHKYRSSRQCGKNKYYLAAEVMVNANDGEKEIAIEEGREIPNNKL